MSNSYDWDTRFTKVIDSLYYYPHIKGDEKTSHCLVVSKVSNDTGQKYAYREISPKYFHEKAIVSNLNETRQVFKLDELKQFIRDHLEHLQSDFLEGQATNIKVKIYFFAHKKHKKYVVYKRKFWVRIYEKSWAVFNQYSCAFLFDKEKYHEFLKNKQDKFSKYPYTSY